MGHHVVRGQQKGAVSPSHCVSRAGAQELVLSCLRLLTPSKGDVGPQRGACRALLLYTSVRGRVFRGKAVQCGWLPAAASEHGCTATKAVPQA